MDPQEFARLQAVEEAAAALLARKGPVTRAALAAALATPAPSSPDLIAPSFEETF